MYEYHFLAFSIVLLINILIVSTCKDELFNVCIKCLHINNVFACYILSIFIPGYFRDFFFFFNIPIIFKEVYLFI